MILSQVFFLGSRLLESGKKTPFTTLRGEVECIIFVGMTALIGTVLMLFALFHLFLREVAIFLSLDKQILLLLQSCPAGQSGSDESEEEEFMLHLLFLFFFFFLDNVLTVFIIKALHSAC